MWPKPRRSQALRKAVQEVSKVQALAQARRLAVAAAEILDQPPAIRGHLSQDGEGLTRSGDAAVRAIPLF